MLFLNELLYWNIETSSCLCIKSSRIYNSNIIRNTLDKEFGFNIQVTLKHLFFWPNSFLFRGVHNDSVEGGGGILNLAYVARQKKIYPSLEFFTPVEKYHDVYQIIGFNWVWFSFSTHFWHLQTPSNKVFFSYLSTFTLFYILHFIFTTKISKKWIYFK